MESNAQPTNDLIFFYEKQVDKAAGRLDSENYKELLSGPIRSAQETLDAYKNVRGIDRIQVEALQQKIALFKACCRKFN